MLMLPLEEQDLSTKYCEELVDFSTVAGLKQPHSMMYPEVSGLAAWSENCKWYSSLLLDAVVPLFCESV
jgi:hypothetical protein